MENTTSLPKSFKIGKQESYMKSVPVLGYEPYFDKFVSVARINHDQKEVSPCHGYFAPHKYGKQMQKFAKKIGYTFNNS